MTAPPLLVVAPLAFAFSALLTPLIGRVARAAGSIDHPSARKQHREPTPLLGGLALALAMPAALLAARHVFGSAVALPRSGVLAGGALSLILGLFDDHRPMGPLGKLTGQLVAAFLLVGWGVDVPLFRENLLAAIVAIVGVAALLNAINFLDAMDGVVGTVTPILAGAFVAMALLHGARVDLGLGWALIGASAGFLVHNAPPARIFMGDAGSHFLGFALAVLALQSLEPHPRAVGVAALLAVLAYPFFDVLFVMVDRSLRRLPVYRAGTDHTTHRLGRALGAWRTLAVVSLVAAAGAGIGLWVRGAAGSGQVAVALSIVFIGHAAFGVYLRRIGPT